MKIYEKTENIELTIFSEIENKLNTMLQEWYELNQDPIYKNLAFKKYQEIKPLFDLARMYQNNEINIKQQRYSEFIKAIMNNS
jgi:hypothetical protein